MPISQVQLLTAAAAKKLAEMLREFAEQPQLFTNHYTVSVANPLDPAIKFLAGALTTSLCISSSSVHEIDALAATAVAASEGFEAGRQRRAIHGCRQCRLTTWLIIP